MFIFRLAWRFSLLNVKIVVAKDDRRLTEAKGKAMIRVREVQR